ncbi:putative ribonuclease H-like domain-containing protein [Tanacetum coccineum]
MPPKPDLSFSGLKEFVNKPILKKPVVETSEAKASADKPKRVNIVNNKNINAARLKAIINVVRPKAILNAVKGNQVNVVKGNPQQDFQEKGVIDSGCLRHMTGNMSYLTDFEEIIRGYVAFRERYNMYSVDLKNIVPKGGLTYLFAKATSDESILWNMRLGHINFKTMNKLVRDETSGILKSFITGVENLIDQRVKVIRCDNGTEFKNKEMNQFCKRKCIKREFSIARTPQQNRVAERKNRTLIVAARKMLVDSKLPTTFWAEAVNTACYVQNRVLVVKPHNKTPYELFLGKKPTLGFMRPFGCPVTILNTINHLGKFDGKADEGFFVGYSINSKAFRVFNSRTRIVEENLQVQFSENTPNIVENGPNWLFDIDALTKLMNYKLVIAGNPSNGNVGTKACDDAGDNEKKVTEEPGGDTSNKNDRVNSTNNINTSSYGNNTNIVNTVSLTVNTAGIEVNVVSSNTSIELLNDLNMPELEDIMYSDDYEHVGVEADMNNLNIFMPVSPIPTLRIHKYHTIEQIIRELNSSPQIRRMTKNLEEHGLFSLVQQRTNHKDFKIAYFLAFYHKKNLKRIEAIRLFLAYALFKDFVVYPMDVKSAFNYGKIEEEVYVCQPPGFEDLDFPDRVYKVEKALYGLHQAPRAWYETLSTYLLDNGFQRGKIDKTLFIRRDKGDILLVQVYVDDIIFGSTKKSLCTEFEKMMHKKFQMSSMGELTFFLGLTPMETQKPLLKDEDGEEVDVHLYRSMIGSLMYLTSSRPDIMFAVCACARYQVNPKVSHLHAVKRIFRYLKGQPKLGLWYPKDSPFDLVAYTDSDYAGASLDRKSTTGGCQFLGCRLISWQCKKQIVVANSTTEVEYVAASSCCGQVRWFQNQLLDYGDSNEKKLIQMIKIHSDKNVADLLTKAFDNGIGVNAGDSKLMLLGINLLLLFKVNAARHKLTTAVEKDPLLDDEEGTDCLPNATIFEELTEEKRENVTTAWNEFSSTMASAIICLATNQKFNFSKYIFESMEEEIGYVVNSDVIPDFLNTYTIKYALTVRLTIYTSCIKHLRSTVKAKMVNGEVQLQALVDGKKIIVTEASVRSDLQLDDEKVFLEQKVGKMSNHKRIYVTPSHTKKIFGNMRRVGKGFSGRETPLFPTMVKQRARKPKRKDTKIPQSSGPTDNVANEAVNEEMNDSLERDATTATSLDAKQDRGEDLQQESTKKQKMDDVEETAEVVEDKETVKLQTDGSSKRYSAFIQRLKSFDKEDLETLWKLVKAKHGSTRPEEGYERVLWGDLRIMFEHHVEDILMLLRGINTAKVRVTAAKKNLVLLKLMLLVQSYNCLKIKTVERVSTLKEWIKTEERIKIDWRSRLLT